ncbi:PAS domain S-box protein [Clostridiales bacterium oral taxon 876 str. F0540]|nr:PAS domain S-box protein [Clostridiales bacterium oral taxon 876 str. F0540]
MFTYEKDNENSGWQIKRLLACFLLILSLSIIFALFFHDKWIKDINIYHTFLELICVFIGLAIFIAVWYTYSRNEKDSHILGFGFLAVSVFDIFHTLYFLRLNVTAEAYFDLSTRFWVLGRLSEAIVIYAALQIIKLKLNKLMSLFFTLATALGVSYLVTAYHNNLPVLLNESGVTEIKVALEYLIIFIYGIDLWKVSHKLMEKGIITYKYIFLSLLMSASSEFCFTLYSSVTSISWTVGHLLKIVSYFFLLKGVFISTVTYPYEKLETEHRKINELSTTLNDILDALPMAVVKHNLNSKVEYVNKKFEELFECSRENLIGLTRNEFLERFPKLEKEENVFSNMKSEDNDISTNSISTYRMIDGEYKKLSINRWKINDGFFSMVRETKEEQELQNLNIQTETIFNAVSNCILMIDTNKKVILCNDASAKSFEMDKKDIVGMCIDELNDLIQFELRDLPDLALSGGSDNQFFEVALVTPKGNKKELMLYLSSIKNVYGEIIGGISVSNDITEFKKQQEKLMQQEKLALLGQMGAAIVHETRNYLTTIKGRCQLINLLEKNEKVQRHALKINSEVDEVNKIISEFLFLSKPRQTELTEISMIDIMESIKSIVRSTSLVKGVDVNVELSKEERYLLCDEGQLKQVILNICKNAVDAMEEKDNKKLEIQTGYNEITNEMFIKISDNGKGISKEELKRLGTPFFTTKSNGTGLGLSVCYNIIKQHKGRIEVESGIGTGTTFNIVLPCIEDDEFDEVI